MIEKVLNIVMPAVRLTDQTKEDDAVLEQHRCEQMVETFAKDYLPDTKAMMILWVDKDGLLSSAACNVGGLKRLELYTVGWMQELFDIKLKRKKDDAKE
jgi:hypothetical protein